MLSEASMYIWYVVEAVAHWAVAGTLKISNTPSVQVHPASPQRCKMKVAAVVCGGLVETFPHQRELRMQGTKRVRGAVCRLRRIVCAEWLGKLP